MHQHISADWKLALASEFNKDYFIEIEKKINSDRLSGIEVFPDTEHILHALRLTAFEDVRVVILGQDPYHTVGMAHGLSFSVPSGQKLPPSLKNIFKELQSDLGIDNQHGCLEKWAQQGVLLLNTCLTVQAGVPMSHASIGWQQFTDTVLHIISEHCKGVVFILWGKQAQLKRQIINENLHLVLDSAHPSPLSAHNGFWGCKHFSKTNAWLLAQGKAPIDWRVD